LIRFALTCGRFAVVLPGMLPLFLNPRKTFKGHITHGCTIVWLH
jgi:hypothetical protein